MARRVSWTNNSSGHSGTYVYRAPTLDPQNLPAPVATVDPVAQGETAEWIDNEELAAGDYDYAVKDFDGAGEGALSAAVTFSIAEDYSSAQPGDEVGGGIYVGVDTINGTDYHIIAAAETSPSGLTYQPNTAYRSIGATDYEDGLANTLIMEAEGLADHPAAAYCLSYSSGGFDDWHMPASSQGHLIGSNLSGHPNLPTTGTIHTSTEVDTGTNRHHRFSDNFQFTTTKYTSRPILPIRRVPV